MKIFISYAHVDRYIVGELVKILRNAGLDPWFDHQLVVGNDWKAQLYNAIEECEAFLYTLSPASVKSDWCQWEFSVAIQLGKSIIPVLINDKVELTEELQRLQYADFTNGPTDEGIAKLMGGLWAARTIIPNDNLPKAPEPMTIPAQAEMNKVELGVNTHNALNTIVKRNIQILFDWIQKKPLSSSISPVFQFDCVIAIIIDNMLPKIVLIGFHDEIKAQDEAIEKLLMLGWSITNCSYESNDYSGNYEILIKQIRIIETNEIQDRLVEDILVTNTLLKGKMTSRRIIIHQLDAYIEFRIQNDDTLVNVGIRSENLQEVIKNTEYLL